MGKEEKQKQLGKFRIPTPPPTKVFKDKKKYERRKKYDKQED